MAIPLTAAGTWPGVSAYDVEPGLDHFSTHIEAEIKQHHYMLAYYGHHHVGQAFGDWYPAGVRIGLCRSVTVAPVYELPLRYIVRPRTYCTTFRIILRTNSDAGASVRFTVTGTAATVTIPHALGVVTSATNLAHLIAAPAVDEVTVELAAVGAGTWAEIEFLGISDARMILAEMP